jgi:hypothetical protein
MTEEGTVCQMHKSERSFADFLFSYKFLENRK